MAKDPVIDDTVVDGLVIDDYFCLARQRLSETHCASQSLAFVERAKATYQSQKIIGSDDKDVLDQTHFQVIGAEVDSRKELVRQGAVTVGAPAAKRLGVASVAALSASLPYTSDALHSSLVGSAVSMVMFRRQAIAIFQHVFQVIAPNELDTQRPKLRPMTRKAAEELALFAALCPVLSSNIAVPMNGKVFATDASLTGGGITSATVEPELEKFLWRSSDRKGENLPLLRATAAILHTHDDDHEQEPFQRGDDGDKCSRPIGMRFDFVEVCGGSGVVTQKLSLLGVVCAPVLDITYSPHFDVTKYRVLEWLNFMLEEGRLLAFLAAPPCTTFSPAAFPALRTYQEPLGIDRTHPRVIHGTKLAHSSLSMMASAKRTRSPGMVEQPRRSKMKRLPAWLRLLQLGAEENDLASCAYGSIHQKEFTFLTMNMNARCLRRSCSRDHQHVVIQGQYTRDSAIYVEGLAIALAEVFRDHIDAIKFLASFYDVDASGLEDPISTDVALHSPWQIQSAWRWRSSAHINILETSSVVKLARHIARTSPDCRFVFLSDSHVSRSALARGRTSSKALRPLLLQYAALAIAYGLYPAGRFVPTRVMPADAPSRGTKLPASVPCSILSNVTPEGMLWLSKVCKIRRWASNWVRLVLLMHPGLVTFHTSPESFRRYSAIPAMPQSWFLDFDQTLGFPGEGPNGFSCCACCGFGCWLAVGCFFSSPHLVVAVWGDRLSHGDLTRQRLRADIVLGEGRRVTELTSSVRLDLLQNLKSWLIEKDLDFEATFMGNPPDLDLINKVLSDYGRALFGLGKPYYHYSETINAVSNARPILRRSLQQAWDLAFIWGSYEPPEHHCAMPYQILLAVITTCFVWGWPREAACFALAWGALLRMGEIYQAKRKDLVLPSDVDFSVDFILLKIHEPKTRFRAARHQAGKMDQPDLMQVVTIGFSKLAPWEQLWPFSGSTLRNWLGKILSSLDLPHKNGQIPKPMSLASFRPGGATWLIGVSESAELVRRRGRWASFRIMEIYLQEVGAATYLSDVDKKAYVKVMAAMHVFVETLSTVQKFEDAAIPSKCWPWFLSHGGF